ncbi:MAG: class I SAM-dependent methyltransferase [Chloroflexi bacterium]|nr:class I SAM-dependent methyltransferase [Chloroflexota bacterium]
MCFLKAAASPFVLGMARLVTPLVKRYARDPRYGKQAADAIAGMLPEFAVDEFFDLWQKHGVHLTPNNYEWPIPDTARLPDRLWRPRSEMPGVDLRVEAQLDLLNRVFAQYKTEYDRLPLEPTSDPRQYHVNNKLFESVDGEVLYCLIRHFRPRRIFEIGAGWSTLLAAQAALKNQQEFGEAAELISIEPFPNETLRAGFPGLSRLIVAGLEDVDLSLFDSLSANDILFIDSSHVLRLGNDVYIEYLELLPRLHPGVLIHIHDVFLPSEYPRNWIVDKHRFNSEQYLLQCFLAFNAEFEVLWASNHMHATHPAELTAAFASYNSTDRCPGSFWLRRRTEF